MVGADGALPLPWLEPALRQTLRTQQAHALLLHGPQGVGQFELALTLAQAWLCEASDRPLEKRPCGVCAGCRLVLAHSHPDLLVLLPEIMQEPLGWGAGADGGESSSEKSSKAKPSREIKVEAVRTAVVFAQTTSARGHGKVVVLHPAERMNGISANTLLKTLEEPPGAARFVLSCGAPDSLLPTIRSRCQAVTLVLPSNAEAELWLAAQGVADPAVLLAAAGGQPQEALAWSQQGIDADLWVRLPALVARGEAQAALSAWPLPRLIDSLQKLCHDAACAAAGAAPRYFPAASIGQGAEPSALAEWARELQRCARHAEHAWNAGLMLESLLQLGQTRFEAQRQTRPTSGVIRYTRAHGRHSTRQPSFCPRGHGRSASERDPARVSREGRLVRGLHAGVLRWRLVCADHSRVQTRRRHLPVALAARRPAALPGRWPRRLDHPGECFRRPNPGRWRAFPERRKDARPEGEDRRSARHVDLFGQADPDHLRPFRPRRPPSGCSDRPCS
jgi:DNA polymerase III subunit delta'